MQAGVKKHLCFPLCLHAALMEFLSVLLILAWQVLCKYTELDLVSRGAWFSFWKSEMHKLFCSVFALNVLVFRLCQHGC